MQRVRMAVGSVSVRLGVLLSAVRSVGLSGCPTFFFRSGSVSVCLFGGGVVRCPLSVCLSGCPTFRTCLFSVGLAVSVCLFGGGAVRCPLSVCLSGCPISFLGLPDVHRCMSGCLFFLGGGVALGPLLSAVAVGLSDCLSDCPRPFAHAPPHLLRVNAHSRATAH